MKTSADSTPALWLFLQGGILINFNVLPTTVIDQHGTRTAYEYDSVKVSEQPTKGEIVSAIIRANYTESDELAIIHNGIDTEAHAAQLLLFNEYRIMAKGIANQVLGEL